MITNKFANESILAEFTAGKAYKDLFLLYGQIDQYLVHSSINIIENKLKRLHFSQTFISKAKMLSVEIIQNIFKHKNDSASIEPFFYIGITADGLKLVSGNSVSSNNYERLNNTFKEYQSLSQEQLKKLYIQKLSESTISENGNAGLGILTILNRSNKNSTPSFKKYSEQEYHFGLEVNLLNN